MADNKQTNAPPFGVATRSVTYSGEANQDIAPTGLVEFSGADDAKTAVDVPIGSMLGAVNETAPTTDTASSGLSGRLQRIAQRLTSLIALLPTGLGANSGLKVDIVGDTGTASVLDSDNLAGITQNTKSILNGSVTLTPKFAIIDRGTSADGAAVVNLVSGKKIRVLRYRFVCAGAVGVKWQSSTSNSSGAGSNTDLGKVESYAANGGIVEGFCPVGIMETVSGEALKLNLNGAVQVSGNLTYVEV